MHYDVVVVGAGLGGLTCAAGLAQKGVRVLVLEKASHAGGTSYVFRRGDFLFPMGPLSFSHPGYVSHLLSNLGIKEPLKFKRNHFQILSPEIDLVYSLTPDELRQALSELFPQERQGLDKIFHELLAAMEVVREACLRCPDYLPRKLTTDNQEIMKSVCPESTRTILRNLSQTHSGEFLRKHLRNRHLINFLGSMGTAESSMSLLTLAVMWNIMSVEGIWYPSWGIYGISDRLVEAIKKYGGELTLGRPVKKIIIENGLARGVLIEDNSMIGADWVVCNADYKTTFLELIEPGSVEPDFIRKIEEVPYTGSELCVYLGLNEARCDFSRLRATHLFYCPGKQEDKARELAPGNKEIEICRWTDNEPNGAPAWYTGLVLRLGLDYGHFARFRTGEKKRLPDYKAYKNSLALRLVKIVEEIIPGLSEAVELMEVATPLTYQDWGHRYLGSIAGWSWSGKWTKSFNQKVLVETPVPNLLMVGIYAASELFMGGVPTAMRTGELASRLILES